MFSFVYDCSPLNKLWQMSRSKRQHFLCTFQCSCTCPYEVSSSAVKTHDTRIAGIVSTFCLYLCQHSNIWCSGPTTVAAIPLAGVNVFLSVDIFCQCESFTATQGTATKCYGWWPSQWWLWSPDLGVLQMVFLSFYLYSFFFFF